MIIRAISLHEPWASAMCRARFVEGAKSAQFMRPGLPLKQWETRAWPWPAGCLGVPVAIAATLKLDFIKDWHHLVANARAQPGHRSAGLTMIRALAEAIRPDGAGFLKASDFRPGHVLGVGWPVRTERAPEVGPRVDEVERSLGGYEDEEPKFSGDESGERWATFFERMVTLPVPVPAKGKQGFWSWTVDAPTELLLRKEGMV